MAVFLWQAGSASGRREFRIARFVLWLFLEARLKPDLAAFHGHEVFHLLAALVLSELLGLLAEE